MFAGLLNKGFRGSLLLLIITFLAGWAIVYFSPRALELEYYPNLFYNYLTDQLNNKLVISSLNMLITGVGVLLVSVIILNQEIVDKTNYFPVFIYLLICLICINPMQVTSQNLTNVFVLFSLYRLLDTYRKPDVLKELFESAFWLCCSAFVTVSSLMIFPVFFIMLLVLRAFSWREWGTALLGFVVPVFFYECIAYLTDFNQWYLFSAGNHFFQYLKPPSFSEYYFPVTGCLFLLLISALFYNLANGAGNTVKKQRGKTILLWLMVFSIPGFFSGGANSAVILLTFAIPVSFFIGDFFYRLRQTKITNTLLTLLLISACVVFAGELGFL